MLPGMVNAMREPACGVGPGPAVVSLGMRIRLLLAAYPKGARRAELEDLLLMAAADGRRGLGSALNLLRHGLRARLGRPGSNGVVALALIVAVVAGFLLGAAANRLSWAAVPGLPAGAARAELGELIAPGLPVRWTEETSADPFPAAGGKVGARRISGAVAGPAATSDLTVRLEADGWRILDTYRTNPPNGAQELLARSADLVLWAEDRPGASGPASRLDVQVYRAEPRWVSAVTFAAGLLGALLGWLIFGWASRRTEHRRAATAAVLVPAVLGLVLLAPALSLGLIFLNVLLGGYVPEVPFWAALVPAHEFGGLAISAGVALGGALLIAARCRPGRDPERATAS